MLKGENVEPRKYQVNIAKVVEQASTLVLLLTGLGKTLIAVLVVSSRLALNLDEKVLVLVPTKPLVMQHYKTFMACMFFRNNTNRIACTLKLSYVWLFWRATLEMPITCFLVRAFTSLKRPDLMTACRTLA